MKIENPAALRFIIDDDLYLLNNDKIFTIVTAPEVTEAYAIIASTPLMENAKIELSHLGGNKKGFLIIVHYPDKEFIDSTHLTALENILKRKELYLDDVAIFNRWAYPHHTFEELNAYFKPNKILIMGKQALPINMEPPLHNQPAKAEKYRLLYSFSFDEMMTNNDNKKAFWDQMKTL